MPKRPDTWGVERLLGQSWAQSALVCTPAVRGRVSDWRSLVVDGVADLVAGLDAVVVVGGGTLIDQVKAWRAVHSPGTFLVAVPSLWGSGAEASPIVVLERDRRKDIRIGEEFLPDVRCIWPELAESVPLQRARWACGDAWSHALEGFLSPLADDELRTELAGVIRTLCDLPISNDPRWFKASGDACAGQARSSVGLVHGIAHALEPVLRAESPSDGWGHARLCATFAWPVMAFNRDRGDKWASYLSEYGVDENAIMGRLRDLHDDSDYAAALPYLDARWIEILRDPCSRTNSTLVRPDDTSFFTERGFK